MSAKVGANGLPVGFQIVGRHLDEGKLDPKRTALGWRGRHGARSPKAVVDERFEEPKEAC
jgi:hypothetical protein